MYRQYFNSKNIEFLESGLLADATITCGDRTWNVHKFIIYRCEWFKKAFNGNFEVKSAQIHLHGAVMNVN
jgi:hypothetical protein